ncbi:hypothetical protein [Roseivivax sediminis]|uniref:Uncharacterized protein n=1 Tax=Roseivivax sediminis TaxID=936889 RepID=A0A1I1VKM9_9RHOB|nr:hypothetical protein [Roseivivax sediminis]SFD83429.1 hypothetical protein SAMN04515678_103257 [Roseivivax sediminis]
MAPRPDLSQLRTPEGNLVGPEELQELMAEQGYSAGDRYQFLKSVLTELDRAESVGDVGRAEELSAEIRRILSNEQEKLRGTTTPEPPRRGGGGS